MIYCSILLSWSRRGAAARLHGSPGSLARAEVGWSQRLCFIVSTCAVLLIVISLLFASHYLYALVWLLLLVGWSQRRFFRRDSLCDQTLWVTTQGTPNPTPKMVIASVVSNIIVIIQSLPFIAVVIISNSPKFAKGREFDPHLPHFCITSHHLFKVF